MYTRTKALTERKPFPFSALMVLLTLALAVVVFCALSVGSTSISALSWSQLSETEFQILWNIRLPRVLTAIAAGASLSISGCLLQAVMQNPLADPGIIGVSSGAGLGAVIIYMLYPGLGIFLPLFSFIGAMVATFLVYVLAWKNGIKPVRLVLSGVAVNALFGGATSLISVLNSEKLQGVLMFLNGSLAGRTWKDFYTIVPYTVLGLLLSLFTIRSCNLLLLGDEKAANLGLHVSRSRILISTLGAFLAASATSVVGIIGFVGLIIPHIGRMVVGSDHRRLVPFSMVLGSLFLLITDTFARTVAHPVELPVGTIMSIVGVPFFLYLLRKTGV